MKFFLDTANLNDIREAVSLGLADGVTTNPSLIAKEGGVDFKQHIAAICELVQGPVSAEVTSVDTEGMLREGRDYSKIAPNVVIKCPLTRDGLLVHHLSARFSGVWTTLAKTGSFCCKRSWKSTKTTSGRRKSWQRAFVIRSMSSRQRG